MSDSINAVDNSPLTPKKRTVKVSRTSKILNNSAISEQASAVPEPSTVADQAQFVANPLDPAPILSAASAPAATQSNTSAAANSENSENFSEAAIPGIKSFFNKLYDIGLNINEVTSEFIVKVEERLGVDHHNVLKDKKGASDSAENSVLDIFKFSDYRAFLKSYYLSEKIRNKGFSFRYFAKKASLRSPNYLKLIIDGKRNLTNEMIFKFAKAIGLTGSRFDYFENMVLFNQAKNNEEKEYYSFRLKSKAQPIVTSELSTEQLQVLGRWYASAICEMCKSPSFKSEPDWIAQRLLGAVSVDEVEQALQLMLECKLLIRDPNGNLKPNFEVTSKENFNSLFGRKSVKSMLKKALDLFEILPREQRKYYTLTFLLPVDKFEYIQDKVRTFERDLLQETVRIYRQMDRGSSVKVMQYNSQIFPLTKNIDVSN